MAEHVVAVDLGVTWHPEAPYAALLSRDDGATALALEPDPADSDRRSVVLVWRGVRSAAMTYSPGPARHRFHELGLDDVRWAGVVRDSTLVQALGSLDEAGDWVHHVVRLNRRIVEVVAASLVTTRLSGDTTDVAAVALTR